MEVGETVGLLDERVREDLEEGGVVDVLDVDKIEDLASIAVSHLPHSSSAWTYVELDNGCVSA